MLRNIWIANFAFFFVTWADDFWGIVSTPRYTALLVILISLIAMAIGFFFERATFCRYLCPIGGLIGIYSMFSGLELRARDREICRLCKGKECYAGTAELPGCPMIQFPATLDRNNYCNLCGDCVKACPSENLTLCIRPFAQDIWKNWRRHLDEAFLAIALVGLTVVITGHMIEPWHEWMDAMTAWIPWQTLGIYDHETVEKWSFSLIYIAAVLIVAPLLLLGSSALATQWAPGKASLNSTFRTYAYMFIPVGIGLHLAHNLLHLLKEGAGIVPVLQRTVAKYTLLQFRNSQLERALDRFRCLHLLAADGDSDCLLWSFPLPGLPNCSAILSRSHHRRQNHHPNGCPVAGFYPVQYLSTESTHGRPTRPLVCSESQRAIEIPLKGGLKP